MFFAKCCWRPRHVACYLLLACLWLPCGCADESPPTPEVPPADPDAAILQRLDTEERARLVGQRWPQLREGMTRVQVEAVVGPPDRDRKDLVGCFSDSRTMYHVCYYAYLTPGPGDKFDGAESQLVRVWYNSAVHGDRYVCFEVHLDAE